MTESDFLSPSEVAPRADKPAPRSRPSGLARLLAAALFFCVLIGILAWADHSHGHGRAETAGASESKQQDL